MSQSHEQTEIIQQWQTLIQRSESPSIVSICGGRTKPALIAGAFQNEDQKKSTSHQVIDTTQLSGIIDYQPSEFTITAFAGTPIQQLDEALRQHGQYLPFDPPQAGHPADASHSTIGGTVAAGINGAGRWRFGGIRDFILECRFIDGTGAIHTVGRRVVKNAAGFDIPKLMVGSCGRLGVLVDITLKVFPRPQDYLTLHVFSENLETAAATLSQIAMAPWELDAVEIQPDHSLMLRLSGQEEVITAHGSRLQETLKEKCSDFLVGSQQDQIWNEQQQWIWNDSECVVARVPMNLRTMLDLDEELEELEIQRRYGSAGNVGWLKWLPHKENPGAKLKKINKLLMQYQLTGMLIRVPDTYKTVSELSLIFGSQAGQPFYQKLKNVFDPHSRLGTFQ